MLQQSCWQDLVDGCHDPAIRIRLVSPYRAYGETDNIAQNLLPRPVADFSVQVFDVGSQLLKTGPGHPGRDVFNFKVGQSAPLTETDPVHTKREAVHKVHTQRCFKGQPN